jgi:hypothetical protein
MHLPFLIHPAVNLGMNTGLPRQQQRYEQSLPENPLHLTVIVANDPTLTHLLFYYYFNTLLYSDNSLLALVQLK